MVDREGALSMWTGDQDVELTGQGQRKQVGMAGRLRELDRPWRTESTADLSLPFGLCR